MLQHKRLFRHGASFSARWFGVSLVKCQMTPNRNSVICRFCHITCQGIISHYKLHLESIVLHLLDCITRLVDRQKHIVTVYIL